MSGQRSTNSKPQEFQSGIKRMSLNTYELITDLQWRGPQGEVLWETQSKSVVGASMVVFRAERGEDLQAAAQASLDEQLEKRHPREASVPTYVAGLAEDQLLGKSTLSAQGFVQPTQ